MTRLGVLDAAGGAGFSADRDRRDAGDVAVVAVRSCTLGLRRAAGLARRRLLNTPSHHRVHHGRNPQYLDRNFGGTLIVWDRLFGSFRDEREPVDFGTRRRAGAPLQSVLHRVFGLGGAPATVAEARATCCASTPPRKLNSRNDRATSSGAGKSSLFLPTFLPAHDTAGPMPFLTCEREGQRLAFPADPRGRCPAATTGSRSRPSMNRSRRSVSCDSRLDIAVRRSCQLPRASRVAGG